MSENTIILGGKSYPIAPLTLGAMRRVAPAFTRIGIDTPDGMAAQISVMQAAMAAADATVTLETVDGIPGVTFAEMKAAMDAIGAMMGLGQKDAPTGEAEAPAAAPEQA
jgi:hypothetical protein